MSFNRVQELEKLRAMVAKKKLEAESKKEFEEMMGSGSGEKEVAALSAEQEKFRIEDTGPKEPPVLGPRIPVSSNLQQAEAPSAESESEIELLTAAQKIRNAMNANQRLVSGQPRISAPISNSTGASYFEAAKTVNESLGLGLGLNPSQMAPPAEKSVVRLSIASQEPEIQKILASQAIPEELVSADSISVPRPVIWNLQQEAAINGFLALKPGSDIIMLGAAGTGKTTTVKEMLSRLWETGDLPKLGEEHKTLSSQNPAVAVVAYTNRAVRNIRRQLPHPFNLCACTIHKLLEYRWEEEEYFDSDGFAKKKRVSRPGRNAGNKLVGLKYLVIEEGSMVGLDLHTELVEALPGDIKILYLGDLNQLPPIYSPAILGFKLADPTIPQIELTEVYRQALDSPILSMAHSILRGESFNWTGKEIENQKKDRPGLSIRPFKKKGGDPALIVRNLGKFFGEIAGTPAYNPEEDVILCPFNKSSEEGARKAFFGNIELNKLILGELDKKNGTLVHEVMSGFFKTYFAVGDRILLGKHEGTITEIVRNAKYHGPQPRSASRLLTRFGILRTPTPEEAAANIEFQDILDDVNLEEGLSKFSEDQIDALLAQASKNEEGKRSGSHILKVFIPDTGETIDIDEAGELNSIIFAYAMSVHKAQGAEYKRVFLILHDCHSYMFSRELLYTAVTRAREELNIICGQDALYTCINRQKIPGRTPREKSEAFKGKLDEKQAFYRLSVREDGIGQRRNSYKKIED